MHVYFSGIGGTAIGPLALIAKSLGYTVSGSDKQDSQYIEYLRAHGITDIVIDQSSDAIAAAHARQPIDWLVYTSALTIENPSAPEIQFCQANGIKTSKRDELLNVILERQHLKLLAVAGTHGKSTTTAMLIWLLKQLGVPIGYNVGAKISYGDMGEIAPGAQYFVYECDEFDRNFLHFKPYISILSGVSWDHHEIFPTRGSYQQAFRDFIAQSEQTILWQEDATYLGVGNGLLVLQDEPPGLSLAGEFNRRDAWLAIRTAQQLGDWPLDQLLEIMNRFPGLQRRMELLTPGLYSDYAHTPEKIRGAMSTALEMAGQDRQVVIVYEPLTDRRQHHMLDDYKDCFSGAAKVYWLPSYLAREDPNVAILTPQELITHLADPSIAQPAAMGPDLQQTISRHLAAGDFVVAIAGGGGGSLDEWLRQEFTGK